MGNNRVKNNIQVVAKTINFLNKIIPFKQSKMQSKDT